MGATNYFVFEHGFFLSFGDCHWSVWSASLVARRRHEGISLIPVARHDDKCMAPRARLLEPDLLEGAQGELLIDER